MSIHYEGSISKKEYLQVIKSHYGPVMTVLQVIAGFVCVFLTANFLDKIIGAEFSQSEILAYYLPGYVFPFVFLLVFIFIPRMQLIAFRNPNSQLRMPRSGEITEEQISTSGPNYSNVTRWDLYINYRLSDNVIALYTSRNCFNIFPRSMFATEDDWQSFVEMVKTKVKKK